DAPGRDRVRVRLGRPPVRRPAGVADAGGAGQRPLVDQGGEVGELALGAAALDVPVHQGGDAGAVIAAILEPAQRLDQKGAGGVAPDDADDAAHQPFSLQRARNSAARLGLSLCRARPKAIASGATSAVMVDPAAMKEPSPSVTGATRVAFEPTNTASPIVVRCLAAPS